MSGAAIQVYFPSVYYRDSSTVMYLIWCFTIYAMLRFFVEDAAMMGAYGVLTGSYRASRFLWPAVEGEL